MPEEPPARRAETLEEEVEALSQLPDRVSALESQCLLLREEMRAQFSQVRDGIRTGDDETRRFMRVLHEEVISRIAAITPARGRKRR